MKNSTCPRGHAKTPENTRFYNGTYICKICDRDRQANRRAETKFKDSLSYALFRPGDELVACFVTQSDAVEYAELHRDLTIRKI